jgi:hypothetical protein
MVFEVGAAKMTLSFPRKAVPKSDSLVLMSRFLMVYRPGVVCAVI